jgi:hypothetical protein
LLSLRHPPFDINRATPLSFFSWVYFGLIFNQFIRGRYPGWWHTYNYVTAAALDAGLILSTIIIFFAITLPGVDIPQWWGNVAVMNTAVSCLLPLLLGYNIGMEA